MIYICIDLGISCVSNEFSDVYIHIVHMQVILYLSKVYLENLTTKAISVWHLVRQIRHMHIQCNPDYSNSLRTCKTVRKAIVRIIVNNTYGYMNGTLANVRITKGLG